MSTDTGHRRRHTDSQEWPAIGCTFCGRLPHEPHGDRCRMGHPCEHDWQPAEVCERCTICGQTRTVAPAPEQA